MSESSSNEQGQLISVNGIRDILEKVMLDLPATKTEGERKMYLAGQIDAYMEFNLITEETREIIYAEFIG